MDNFRKKIYPCKNVFENQTGITTTGYETGGRAISAPPIRRWTTRHRAISVPDISAPFHNFFLFFELWSKNSEAGNFLNSVEREPIETRVLNPTASESS